MFRCLILDRVLLLIMFLTYPHRFFSYIPSCLFRFRNLSFGSNWVCVILCMFVVFYWWDILLWSLVCMLNITLVIYTINAWFSISSYASFVVNFYPCVSLTVECYHNVLVTCSWDVVVTLILFRIKVLKLSKYMFLAIIEIFVHVCIDYIWVMFIILCNRPESLELLFS